MLQANHPSTGAQHVAHGCPHHAVDHGRMCHQSSPPHLLRLTLPGDQWELLTSFHALPPSFSSFSLANCRQTRAANTYSVLHPQNAHRVTLIYEHVCSLQCTACLVLWRDKLSPFQFWHNGHDTSQHAQKSSCQLLKFNLLPLEAGYHAQLLPPRSVSRGLLDNKPPKNTYMIPQTYALSMLGNSDTLQRGPAVALRNPTSCKIVHNIQSRA